MPDTEHQPPRSGGEKIFLAALIIMTLLFATAFTIATVGWGFGFPATMVAFLLAVFVGTLAYTFLGGVQGAVFKMGAMKLAGTTAAIVVIFYVVEGPMDKNMRDVRAVQLGKTAETRIEQEQEKATAAIRRQKQAEQRVRELEAQSGETESTSVSAMLARIENSTADDRLGKGVLELYRNEKGPFDRTIRTLRLPVRFNSVVESGTFRFCHDKQADLRGKPVRFEIVDRDAGTSERITLKPGADIGPGLCSEIQFEVMLGCDAATALLPAAVSRCDSRGGVAWNDPSANRIYELTATILNPELASGP